MRDEKGRYAKLFGETFRLSACTFGGGFVIIPLMRKRFVEELNWIEEQEMLDLTAIAQSSPGAIPVNASILVGYHVAGIPGALITVLGTVLPPLVIISVISFFYAAFRDNPVVNLAMTGLSAPMRFCSFSPNRICRKMAGNGVQPLHNYTCRFRPSSLKQADKSGLDGLQTGKSDSG